MIPVAHLDIPPLPRAAPVVLIRESPGGRVDQFDRRIRQYELRGSFVRVTGECASACTMVLRLGDRMCATATASFGFHQAFTMDPRHPRPDDVEHRSDQGTAVLWSSYPAAVQGWIDWHGGLTSTLIWLRGAELRAVVPMCE